MRKWIARRVGTKRKYALSGAALAVSIAMAAAGCASGGGSSGDSSGSGGNGTINIGALIPETGAFSAYAPLLKEGIDLALQQVHYTIGGHKVHLITLDDATNLTTALSDARQLVDSDHVVAILGPLDSEITSGLEPFLAQNKVPAIAWESTPASAGQSGWVVTPGGDLPQIAYSTGQYAASVLKLKTADMITDDYVAGWEIGGGFAMGFQKGGGKIVQPQWDPLGTTNFQPYVSALGNAQAVAVWNPATEATFIQDYELVQAAKSQQLIIDYADVPFQSQITKALGRSFAGTYSDTSYNYTLNTPANKKFVAAFKSAYHANPDLNGEAAYEDMLLLITALRNTHETTNSTTLQKALHSTTFSGPAGTVQMGPSGFPTRAFYVVKLGLYDGAYTWLPVRKYPKVAPILNPIAKSKI